MSAAVSAAQSVPMSGDTRGRAIQERVEALGIGDRDWYAKTGIDRKTLKRAMAGEPGTRASTYLAIESALDKLEAAIHGQPTHALATEDFVEFTIEGNFGVRAVVKGPVKDMDELQRAVSKLVRDMRSEDRDSD